MKFSPQPPAFTPIQMVLESPEEVAAVFALLNHTTISAAVGLRSDKNGPWQDLKNANASAGNPKIEYAPLHEALEALLRHRE